MTVSDIYIYIQSGCLHGYRPMTQKEPALKLFRTFVDNDMSMSFDIKLHHVIAHSVAILQMLDVVISLGEGEEEVSVRQQWYKEGHQHTRSETGRGGYHCLSFFLG